MGLGGIKANAACNVACLSVHEAPGCFSLGVAQNSPTDQGEILVTRPHVPVSITFEVSVSVCMPGDVMSFYLNGTLLGSAPVDPQRGCVCSPGIQQFVIADAQAIEGAWILNGENVLRFTKTSNGGSYYSWVRAVLDDGQSRMTACINDFQGGNCDNLNQCGATYTSGRIDVSAAVQSGFEEVLFRQAYAGTELPTEIDLATLPDGLLHFVITGTTGRDQASLVKSGHRAVRLNRPCNSAPSVTCPASGLAECGSQVSLSFATDDADGDRLSYGISVNGTPADAGAVDASGLVIFQPSLRPGTYRIVFTVADAAASADCALTLTVQDSVAPQIAVLGENPLTVACHGVYVDPGVLALDACAGDLTSAVVTTGTVDITIPGSYTVTYSVSDAYGNYATAWRMVEVVNSAPVLHSVTGPADPVALGTSVIIGFAYADADQNQRHLATVHWGDGSQSSYEVPAQGAFDVEHTYSLPGVYTVSVTVTDTCGAQAAGVYQYVVVFDPSGGLVTGGGWFNSPAGSYAGSATAGRAYFGFVAKLHAGETVPKGNTHFRLGDMSFRSTSYESLAVYGNRAQIRGAGQINGGGDYVFLLTATDFTSSDHLRMQIWNRSNGALVYDNRDATLIDGGNITVHR